MAEGGIGYTDSETESVPGLSSLYSRHSRVSQVLEAFQDTAVCTFVTRG